MRQHAEIPCFRMEMYSLIKPIQSLEKELIDFLKRQKLDHAIIIAIFKGEKLPPYCTHMLCDPELKEEIKIDSFIDVYNYLINFNESFKDGALLIQVKHDSLILKGVHYRLYPPPLSGIQRRKNKGSGYNSALDFSGVSGVICVYILNKEGVTKFINGKEVKLC